MKKTAIQSLIDLIQKVLDSREANESNCDDYELGLIESIKALKLKLPQEKQDLIDAFDEASLDGDKLGLMYFNQTFES